jgi:predicted metal-dependent HD superfamily phosphohydrolase
MKLQFCKGISKKQTIKMNEQWTQISSQLEINHDKREYWWNIVQQHYQEPQRAYHTLQHISELFALYEQYKNDIPVEKQIVVQLCILFHEYV